MRAVKDYYRPFTAAIRINSPPPTDNYPMPSTDLRLAIVPIDMIPGDTAANLDSIESKIASLPADTDLVVLPEMCNTGYTIDPGLVGDMPSPLMVTPSHA